MQQPAKQIEEQEDHPVELYEVNLLVDPDQDSQSHGPDHNPFGAQSPKHTDGINADEFEHIAEIYDQIRLLHQQLLFSERSNSNLKTQVDRNLASYFD